MTLRRAGARWRLLVHEPGGVSHHVAHDPAFGGFVFDAESLKNHELPGTEFDELVVGRWLHIEQQDTGTWWMNIGGVTVWVRADREGRPRSVDVYGPGDYADPEPGVVYGGTALAGGEPRG